VNAPVQGSAGDTVLFVMAHLHRLIAKRKMPSKFVNQVHDSVMLEMDNSQALIDDTKELVELVIKDVVQSNSMFRWIRVPLECEYKTGQNWGELAE
jgi:DNA polymerase I-like protein with 3'-5' exonuclease and polymerase domains